MQISNRIVLLGAGALLVVTACAFPAPQATTDGASSPAAAVKKRATLAASSSLVSIGSTFVAALPGAADVNALLDAGLTNASSSVIRSPQLAEVMPTTENGLWKVLADGRMETTWKIHQNATWHDDTPFKAEDLIFTFEVLTDKQLAARAVPIHNSVESLEPLDPHTLLIRWKSINISADQIFSGTDLPLPRHLLEAPYKANRETFQGLSFWTRDYVGTGPFRMKEFSEGSHALLEANPTYFLGRPLIDELEVRFIPDSRALVANVLAGEVHLTLSRGMSSDQAAQLKDTWKGRIELDAGAPNHVVPQHGTIREPEIIGNVDFRRALLQAVDRQEMANVLTGGLGTIAHSGLPYGDPSYRDAEAGVVKYDFDPGKSARALEGLGYTLGPDGKLVARTGAPLRVELRTSEKEINVKTVLTVGDYWKRVGVDAETFIIPAALQSNPEVDRLYKGFKTGANFGSLSELEFLTEAEIPTPQNSFRGKNTGQYVNAELEAQIRRYTTTIPLTERMQALRAVFGHLTENVVDMPLYYEMNPTLIAPRLVHVQQGYYGDAHLWDVS